MTKGRQLLHCAVRLALGAGLAGCCTMGPSGVKMTPQVIQQDGTHQFTAPFDKVFAATEGALKSEGFPIAQSDPDKGLIKTGPKLVRAVTQGDSNDVTGSYSATHVEITRQYVVHLVHNGTGTSVSAEPRIFQGNAELTDQAVWVLDTSEGERALWQRLFRDINDGL